MDVELRHYSVKWSSADDSFRSPNSFHKAPVAARASSTMQRSTAMLCCAAVNLPNYNEALAQHIGAAEKPMTAEQVRKIVREELARAR
jgi:hypothetical protein